jgi:tight adherence protein B
MMAELAMLCAAGAVWTYAGPSHALLRLHRVLGRGGRSWPHAVTAHAGAALRAVRMRRERARVWRAAVIELCDGVAAELTAGRAPGPAFAESVLVLDPAAAAALLDARPDERLPDLLVRTSQASGAEGLRLLAACWRVGAEHGGALAGVVQALADGLREEEAHRLEVAAQLAGPRASARLLAGLPLLGLGMAAALGARPLAFLFGTLPGAGCLLGGVGLDVLGLWWTQRLATAAETPR